LIIGYYYAILLLKIQKYLTLLLDFFFLLLEENIQSIKQKDKIIDKLLEGEEELLTKSFNETTSNTNDLDKLNEIANNKLHILKEEHKKYYLAITVSKH